MNFAYNFSQILQEDQVTLPRAVLDSNSVGNILQIVFSLAGGIALLIITIAGLRFVVSNGDPNGVAKAKNTIIYATLGLIVCISGFSIVTFLLRRI